MKPNETNPKQLPEATHMIENTQDCDWLSLIIKFFVLVADWTWTPQFD